MKQCKNVYTVSENAQNYLKAKNIFPKKIKLSKLGTFDFGINPFQESEELVIVSCSNIISLKRVDLIPEILKGLKIKAKWIHFGDGDQKDIVQEKLVGLKPYIRVILKGPVTNEEILSFYQQNTINLFMHLSESEGGVPVALQEAASFGIPLLGTNVGGIPEIVNEHTGILIPKDFDISSVSEILNTFTSSEYNTEEFRKNVKIFWSNNFNAENNYMKFYEQISKQ